MAGAPVDISCVWGPGSIFNRQAEYDDPQEVLPSLRESRGFTRAGNVARYAASAYLPTAFMSLASVEEQKACIRRVLRMVCVKHVIPVALPAAHEGLQQLKADITFMPAVASLAQTSGRVEIAMGGVVDYRCVPVQRMSYLRLDLTGKRGGNSRSREWMHRLVCWVMHGPPPSNDFKLWQAGHKCGNSWCVCPMHMQWMTGTSNRKCKQWHDQFAKAERLAGLHMFAGPFDLM